MVVKKKIYYGGFHGLLAPVIPKAPRSLRVSVKLIFLIGCFSIICIDVFYLFLLEEEFE